MLFSGIPRIRLLSEPTPLEKLNRIGELTGHPGVYVKRDDCMPLGLGGNKVRSLEFWLGEALDNDCDIIVVAGAHVSNQCRLAAAAAAKIGLECLILHSSDEPLRNEGNLLLNRLLGAEVRFIGPVSEEERAERAREVVRELEEQGRRPYLMAPPVTGALGYVAGALELHHQADAMDVDLRHVVIPGSMGPTEAGFLFGLALLGNPFTAHVVSIEYEKAELVERVEKIYAAVSEKLGITPAKDFREFTCFYDEYLGDGYDRPTPESLAAIRTFASREGVFLENTYSSKTFAGMLDLIKRGTIPAKEAVCCLHTGGVPALFGQADLFTRPN